MRRILSLFGAVLGMATCATTASAQDVVPRDMYQERIVQDNKITFCYNGFSMMSEFEQDLARAIGDVLLAETELFTYQEGDFQTLPTLYDYRIPIVPDQVFVLLAQNCSAMMGYVISPVAPEWMKLTRPYLSSNAVLFSDDPQIKSPSDLTGDVRIGARVSSPGDAQLISYTGGNKAWKRIPYANNGLLIDRVLDGTNDLGMMWEHGFTFANHELGGKLHKLDSLPFNARSVELAIATRSQDGYLNDMLSEAIAALQADGTIDALFAKHNMLPEN